MKKFDELTEEQQAEAVKLAEEQLLEAIVYEGIHFDDEANGNDLQARIDAAFAKAERMQTPWYAGNYIMDTCKEDIHELAMGSAMEALYAEPNDPPVVTGIIQ